MSAFICGPDHFKALAVFAVQQPSMAVPNSIYQALAKVEGTTLECAYANVYANVLYQENIRSVLARYPQDTLDSAPGPHEKPEKIVISQADMDNPAYNARTPIQMLKLCNCLDYQSCETNDWQNTHAFHLLEQIKALALAQIPMHLHGKELYDSPEYNEAPWDYYVEEDVKA